MFYFRMQEEKSIIEAIVKKTADMCLMNESDAEDLDLPEELKEKLKNIKSEADLKKFIEENASKIKESYKKADEKTKPFYISAWDCLCKAVSSTAGFVLDHLGGILILSGILYAGHKIGFSNIVEFFTGNNPEQKKKFEKSMKADTDMKLDAIHAVNPVKEQLSPEQQKEIFALRRALPDPVYVADTATVWNWLSNFGRTDTALADAARKAAETNKNSSEKFMEEIGAALKQGADHVQKVIDKWKKKVPSQSSTSSQSIVS